MRKSGDKVFEFKHRKQTLASAFISTPDSTISQDSTYFSRSDNLDSSNFMRSKSEGLTSVFMGCFVCGKPERGEDNKDIISQSSTVSSFSASRTSARSSSTHSPFRFNASTKSNTLNKTARKDTTGFTINEIYQATGYFSAQNIIGQGGFGTVYKGKLKDGTLVAVKRAKKNLYNQLSSEFKKEIQAMSKIEHMNLVRFLGYVEHDDEQIILLEYVENGTLREHLHSTGGDTLELAQRMDIAIDVAHAVTYLHMYTDQPIIHRDIKASNILLTDKLRAKVADFGSARLASHDTDATHITTDVKGSAGYVDPEYLRTYQLTDKSDVYSFGVVLVELVSGRHPIERKRAPKERLTTRWAIEKSKQGDVVLAMDPRIRRSPASIFAAEKIMLLATECLAPSRRSRPSMKKCAETLWKIRKEFTEMQLSKNEALKRKEFEQRIGGSDTEER